MTKKLIITTAALVAAALLAGCSMEVSASSDNVSYKGSIFVTPTSK